MRVSLKAVPGVENVKVSLASGVAAVEMKPGNATTLKQLNDAIARNGFTMKQSAAVVSGQVELVAGKPQLRVTGSNELLELLPATGSAAGAGAFSGKQVTVAGTIPEAAKGKIADSLQYNSIQPEER